MVWFVPRSHHLRCLALFFVGSLSTTLPSKLSWMVGNPIEKVTIDKPDGFIHLLFVPYETAKEAHMAWHGMACLRLLVARSLLNAMP
jgi:hypothetical protein